jgi:hypothetical protein
MFNACPIVIRIPEIKYYKCHKTRIALFYRFGGIRPFFSLFNTRDDSRKYTNSTDIRKSKWRSQQHKKAKLILIGYCCQFKLN